MEIKQLDNYKIEFLTDEEYCNLPMYSNREWLKDKLFIGNCDDISEELASKIVDNLFGNSYKDYQNPNKGSYAPGYTLDTAKQSFQTLSDLLYCVIFKNIK